MTDEGQQSNPTGGRQPWRDRASRPYRPIPPKPGAPDNSGGNRPKPIAGGKKAAAGKGPIWYRLAVPVALLVVVLAILYVLITQPLPVTNKVKPRFAGIFIVDFSSALIPTNDWASCDKALFEKITPLAANKINTENTQTPQNLAAFFDKQIHSQELKADEPLIVYLSTHGVSDGEGGYLLHSETDPADPTTGYKLSTLLEQMARCKAPNKLLILDCARFDGNVDMGMLGNDFIHHVKEKLGKIDAEAKRDAAAVGNLAVLVSCQDGEQAWASPSLRQSPFAHAVAYCLGGGGDADMKQNNDAGDDLIFVSELEKYTAERVSRWSARYRGSAQKPKVLLQIGADFAVAQVDPTCTPEFIKNALTEAAAVTKDETAAPVPAEKSAEPAAEKTAPEAVAKADAKPAEQPAKSASDKPAGPATEVSVLKQLKRLWTQRRELAETSAALDQSLAWNALQWRLYRAERLLLAGQYDAAQNVLQPHADRLLAVLRAPMNGPIDRLWSVVAVKSAKPAAELAAEAKALDEFIDAPSAQLQEKVTALLPIVQKGKKELAEACLLALYADLLRPENLNANASAVQAGLRCRRQAEDTAAVVVAGDSRITAMRKAVEEADRVRRKAEIDLSLGRTARAVNLFANANSQYLTAKEAAQKLQGDLVVIREMAGAVAYVVRWLALDPREPAQKIDDGKRLSDFLDGLQRLPADPSNLAVGDLADNARKLKDWAKEYAKSTSTDQKQWRQWRAALELPFLEPEVRDELLTRILKNQEASPFEVTGSDTANNDGRPANPVPLVALARFFNDQPLQNALTTLEPGSQPVTTFRDLAKSTQLRTDRAEASRLLRTFLAQRRKEAETAAESPEGLPADLHRRVALAFRAVKEGEGYGGSSFEPARQSQDQQWLADRFKLDDLAHRNEVYRATIRLFDSGYHQRREQFELTGNGKLTLPDGEAKSQEWEILVPRDWKSNESATLVLDWFADRDRMRVNLDKGIPDEGEVRLTLPIKPGEKNTSLTLALKRLNADKPAKPPQFTARIERSNGAVDWLNTKVEFEKPPEIDAVLVLKWNDKAGRADQIQLFPNQKIPIDLRIDKKAPKKLNLQLKLTSGSAEPVTIAWLVDDKQMGKLPIPIDQPMTIEDGILQIELFSEGKSLDKRSLKVELLEPPVFLKPTVDYDPQKRELSVALARNNDSDSDEPILLKLEMGKIATSKLDPQRTMAADDKEPIRLTARIADAADDSEFPIAISAAGWPRAFRYKVGANRISGEPLHDLQVSIVSPGNLEKFKSEQPRLPVVLNVDAPDGAKPRVSVQFDGASKPRPVDYDWGRDIKMTLAPVKGKTEFVLGSTVDDIKVVMPIQSRQGKKTLIAEAQIGNRSAESASIDLFFLKDAPELKFITAGVGGKVVVGDPIDVEIAVSDPDLIAAVDDVQFGFDKNGNGKLDMEEIITEPLRPLSRRSEKNLRTIRLSSDKLAEGEQILLARAASNVVNEKGVPPGPERLLGEIEQRKVEIIKKDAPGAPKAPPPKNGALVVKTLVNGGPIDAKVKVEELTIEPKNDSKGEFKFEDVKPGVYTVSATYKEYKSPDMMKVTVKSDETAEVTLTLK